MRKKEKWLLDGPLAVSSSMVEWNCGLPVCRERREQGTKPQRPCCVGFGVYFVENRKSLKDSKQETGEPGDLAGGHLSG